MKIGVVNLAVALIALLMFPANALSQAGKLQATGDDYIHVLIPASCVIPVTGEVYPTQFQIGFKKVAWDKDGKLVDVRGLEPVVLQLNGPKINVVSDLKQPSLKDGVLTLTLDGQPDVPGKVDIPFVIKYGRSGTVSPQNLMGCSAGCCLVAH